MLTLEPFTHPLTRIHVRLLGMCFKTSQIRSPQANNWSSQVLWHIVTALATSTTAATMSPQAYRVIDNLGWDHRRHNLRRFASQADKQREP
ncbi:senescence-associated protein [Senna tora]|uniref:Senescence-associated protein n=1 Tax=Senna tora TaxID=362788 RepID=A0A834TA00_9FABA|nr:senescence-associated protein [Senna tora]